MAENCQFHSSKFHLNKSRKIFHHFLLSSFFSSDIFSIEFLGFFLSTLLRRERKIMKTWKSNKISRQSETVRWAKQLKKRGANWIVSSKYPSIWCSTLEKRFRIENVKKSLKHLLKILKIIFEGIQIQSFGQRKHKAARNDWIMRFQNVWHCLGPLRVW